MQIGDLIRLKFPFTPNPSTSTQYQYAIVAEFIYTSLEGRHETDIAEVLVYLCAGDRFSIYVDELGVQPLYSFSIDEIAEVISSANHFN